jgi:hypothetical protein
VRLTGAVWLDPLVALLMACVLFAVGARLVRRAADGRWSTLATSTASLAACAALPLPVKGSTIFVGTNDARVLCLAASGALEPVSGFDRVEGRETWYAGTAVVDGRVVGPPLGVRSMSATCDGRALLVNVHVGGIPRSVDGGETWQPTIDVESDVHEVRAHPTRPELVAAATAVGLALSRDGGATWAIEDAGLHAKHCSAVAFVGDEVWVSASTDPFTKDGAVYARPIASAGPLRRVPGLPEWFDGKVDTGCIAVSGEDVAVADAGGHVYVSGDGGARWTSVGAALPYPIGALFC